MVKNVNAKKDASNEGYMHGQARLLELREVEEHALHHLLLESYDGMVRLRDVV